MSSNRSDGETYILGVKYSENKTAEIKRHCQTLMRFTYRNNFPPLTPYHYTDDTGWGCMLRCAQMLMGQVYQRHYLGNNWRLPPSIVARRDIREYCEILRWFADYPGPPCLYSIHHIVQCGMAYDKLPGEWFGPSTAAYVLRDLAHLHRKKYKGQVEVHVTNGDTIYTSEIEKLFQVDASPPPTVVKEEELPRSSSADGAERVHNPFYDPLLNPPPASAIEWGAALLVIIPLRLGIDNVNTVYHEELKEVLRSRFSVGILGGRPNRAIYFVGYRGDTLLGLDPHVTLPNPSLQHPFPSEEYMCQIHRPEFTELPLHILDPSLAVAFYFRSRVEYMDFVEEVTRRQEAKKLAKQPPIFSIAYSRAATENITMDWEGGSDRGNSDIEEEYVFV